MGKKAECLWGKLNNSCEIADGHHAHGYIYKPPCSLKSNETACKDSGATSNTIDVEPFLLVWSEKSDIVLSIEIVGYDGAVCKKENGCSKEPSASRSKL